MKRVFLVILLAGMITCACTNSQITNEKKFSKAIQDYLDYLESSGVYCAGPKRFPYNGAYVDPANIFKSLNFIYDSGWHVYKLTEEGKRFFSQGKGFCYGKPILENIINFTTPQVNSGITVTDIVYTYKLSNIPEWVNNYIIELNKLIEGDNPDEVHLIMNDAKPLVTAFREGNNGLIRGKGKLIKTSNGWIHEQLFQ